MLRSGGNYLQAGGHFVRHIEAIVGKQVYWRDRVGAGRCTKETFIKNCLCEATEEEVAELYPLMAQELP
jgi:peptidyl-tRNA hydrolase